MDKPKADGKVEKDLQYYQARRTQAVELMNPPLHAAYLELGETVAKADISEAHQQYEIGVITKRVSDVGTYGTKAVKLLATALGCNRAALYAAARVAACWTPKEFNDLLARATLHRRPLSFSHVVVLARVSNRKKRDAHLEAALELGLSVIALQRLVDGRGAYGSTRHPTYIAKSVVAKNKSWSKWLEGLDPDIAARSETRETLQAAAIETRAFLKRLEATLSGGKKSPPQFGAKSAKGKGEKDKVRTFRQSVPKVFGGPGEDVDGEA